MVSMQQSGVLVSWFLGVSFSIFLIGLLFQVGWQLGGCDDIDDATFYPNAVAGNATEIGVGTLQHIVCWRLWGTRRDPPFVQNEDNRESDDWNRVSITIFAAPTPPLTGTGHRRLRRAIASWLMLRPTVHVVLLGNSPELNSLCQEGKGGSKGGARVVCESDVDTTIDGVPLLNSMLDRARAAESEIAVVVDPADLILLPAFTAALERAWQLDDDWLLASASWRVQNLTDLTLPANESMYSAARFSMALASSDGEVRTRLQVKGVLQKCRGIGVLAWNTATTPLHAGVTPPFFMGFRGYEGWVLSEAINSKVRHVIDGSDIITAIVEDDGVEQPMGIRGGSPSSANGSNLSSSDRNEKPVESLLATIGAPAVSRWEEDVNMYWAVSYGMHSLSRQTIHDATLRMERCHTFRKMKSSRICLVKQGGKGSLQCRIYCRQLQGCSEGSECNGRKGEGFQLQNKGSLWEDNAFTKLSWASVVQQLSHGRQPLATSGGIFPTKAESSKGDSQVANSRWYASCKCHQFAGMCPLPDLPHPSSVVKRLSMPHGMESLAARAAGGPEKLLVLTVAALNYAEFLFSWVCRMQALNLTNYIIGALDEDLYHMGVLRGLPIFRVRGDELDSNVTVPMAALPPEDNANMNWLKKGTTLEKISEQPNECYFGTECFTRLTKYKSRMVLHLLRRGYNVLFSDVDVYWFKNPIQTMWSYGPGHLVVQSDNYNETGPDNDIRRVNSGFYLARNDTSTVTAFQHIIAHALASKGSEQPSFYVNLCGSMGEYRAGENRCRPPLFHNLTVVFLDRKHFPNGASYHIWEANDPKKVCEEMGCYVLHNNWVSGREPKLERQLKKGLMDFDMSKRSCKWRWRNENSMRMY